MTAQRILGLATLALLAPALPHAGTARASAGQSPAAQSILYAGGYGLYRSTDDGQTWHESDSGLPTGGAITGLAVAPGSTTVYAGTNGKGIFISTDGGTTWQDDNGGNTGLQDAYIKGLAVNPARSQDVYAITDDDQFYASTDSGADWTATALPSNSYAFTLALNPGNPAMLLVGTGSGIFRSDDEGNIWSSTTDGPTGYVYALAYNPHNPAVAFAATDNGIYQTIDGGTTWEVEPRGIPAGTGFWSIAVDPANGTRIIAGSGNGILYRSQDGGTSWTAQGTTDGATIDTIAFDPAQPGTILTGAEDGDLYIGTDNGGQWQSTSAPGGSIDVLAFATRSSPPTDAVPAPQGNPYGVRYFSQTHHTVRGAFLRFYTHYNGLAIFGLPLTEAFSEGGHLVQYFERSRMVSANGRVTLTPLGSQLTAGRTFAPVPCCPPAGQQWFAQTHHSLSGAFLRFWRSHNGSVLFGAPISQPLYEQNGDGTGRTYLVQYFQNARMEYHPELAGTANVVSLGLLGRQVLRQRGWL